MLATTVSGCGSPRITPTSPTVAPLRWRASTSPAAALPLAPSTSTSPAVITQQRSLTSPARHSCSPGSNVRRSGALGDQLELGGVEAGEQRTAGESGDVDHRRSASSRLGHPAPARADRACPTAAAAARRSRARRRAPCSRRCRPARSGPPPAARASYRRRGTTNASSASPSAWCGTPITAACAIAGWVSRKLSTSAGNTLKPPTWTTSFARPAMVTLPAGSSSPRSPVRNQSPSAQLVVAPRAPWYPDGR